MHKFWNTMDKFVDSYFKVGLFGRIGLAIGVLWLVLTFSLSSLFQPPVKVIRHDLLHVITYNYMDNNGFIHTKCKYYKDYKKHGEYYAITLENGNVLTVHEKNIIKLGN